LEQAKEPIRRRLYAEWRWIKSGTAQAVRWKTSRYREHSITHRSACALPLTLIQRHSGQALALHLVPGTDWGTLSELLYDNLHCRVSVSSCRQAQRTLP